MPSPPVRQRHAPLALAIILLLTALTFLPVLRHEFTNWDDPQNITSNPLVMSPSWAGLGEVWRRPVNAMYSPMVFTSFMADTLVGRGDPWSFHATNLLLHLGATAAVFQILRRLPGVLSPWSAAAGALLFAVHPLQAEPVAWATGRKDVLAGMFALVAIAFHLRGNRAGSEQRELALRVAGAVAFTLSLLAKASGVALPLAVLGIEVFVERQPWRRSVWRLAPWLAVAGILSLVAVAAEPQPAWLQNAVPVWRRPLVAAFALFSYAAKTLFPVGLAPVYPVNATDAAFSPISYVLLLAVLLILTTAALYRGRFTAALLVFLAPLLPVLGLVPFLYQQISVTADRYTYISLLAVGMGTVWLLEGARSSVTRGRLAGAVVVLVAAACLVLTYRQARYWKDPETLWTRAVSISSGVPEAHTNLGFALHHRGDLAGAEAQFEKAVSADPDFSMAWNLLGLLRLQRAGPDAAIPALREAVRALETKGYQDKRLAEALNNLGVALQQKGSHSEAEQHFRRSLTMYQAGDTFANLAETLEAQGRKDEAKAALDEAAKRGSLPTTK